MAEVFVLSDVGKQAINNASAGGVLVDATYFKVGDSAQNPNKRDITDLLGITLFKGGIHHVEVLNKNTCRFVFEIPGYSVTEQTEIREVAVYLSNNILLGRAVPSESIVLIPGETIRLNVLLITNDCDVSTINVTIGDYSATPMTPFIHQLPNPGTSQFNFITVLNGFLNADGSETPIGVMKFGSGSFEWAFQNYNRVYHGKPKAATTTTLTVDGLDLKANELVIVHIVSGNGAGQTRRYRYTNNVLTEADSKPIAGLDAQATVAVWKSLTSQVSGNGNYPPDMEGVPYDWVLTRGYGELPVWAAVKSGSKSQSTLYTEPSKLSMNVLNYTGNGSDARFTLGALNPDNVNYIHPALGGINQHRSAFDFSGSEIEFAEPIDANNPIDLRVFTREASTGSRYIIKTDHFVGDGITTTYKLSQAVENARYIKAYVTGGLQSTVAYTYDEAAQTVIFVEPIPVGIDLELRSFARVDDEGYSTQISSMTVTTSDDTLFLELPIYPQSPESIEISQSGTHIHGNLYTVVDNKVVLTGPIRKGLEVEVLIYNNVRAVGSKTNDLKGVVTDAVLTARSLKLLRHNDLPLTLPIPGVSLEAGPGIRITGTYPLLTIESTIAEQLEEASNFKVSTQHVENDTTEVMFTTRVDIKHDMLITVTSDFAAELGPGFTTEEGNEVMEYVVGFRSTSSREPDYGKRIKGSGRAGFNSLTKVSAERAYANASLTQIYEIIASNHASGYIDIVAKMRVRNANIGNYNSVLTINFNVTGTAKISS